MCEFTITRQIDAPVETVWEVLDDFGDIQRWNPAVNRSEMTSHGPMGEGSTRRCDFSPFGGVEERVEKYEPQRRLTLELFAPSKLPISGAVADFRIGPDAGGTKLTIHYSYTLNLLGSLFKRQSKKRIRQGVVDMTKGLQRESERLAAG